MPGEVIPARLPALSGTVAVVVRALESTVHQENSTIVQPSVEVSATKARLAERLIIARQAAAVSVGRVAVYQELLPTASL